ncbi:MAG TPA: tetratricopeptide repeat protein [Tepidisphaeraceae bacterium]|nr:tetratricopeptide repeat protein [Tepidisphaeraceae bacterium]
MGQNLFQIALEHHRAGRLTQAEAGYRDLILTHPDHADALHWLGVLLFQAGQTEAALALLERAAKLRPIDAAFQHGLGQAQLRAGQFDDAVLTLGRAAALEPARVETLVLLAHAHLARRREHDPAAAVTLLRRALASTPDSAALHRDLGIALLAAGETKDAIASLRAAVARDRDDAAAYHHLALAHRARGEAKEVRKCLNKALEINASLSGAWHLLGLLDAEAGNRAQAIASLRRAVRAKPDFVAAHQALGQLLEDDGRPEEARHAFEMAGRAALGRLPPNPAAAPAAASVADLQRRLAPDPNADRLHHALAAATGLLPPAHVPPEQVAALFDRYAQGFDQHLRDKLGYRVPEMLAAAVAATAGESQGPMDVLDLGCGTGLCGLLLRPMARVLRGVDLSPAMVAKARERNVYDEVVVGDLLDALRAGERQFDLLAAADVLNYVGDLAPVVEVAASALRPGGRFAFSVEAGGGERFHLQKHVRRYAHSEPYLRHVAGIYGFAVRSLEPIVVRHEANRPVSGFLVILALPAE